MPFEFNNIFEAIVSNKAKALELKVRSDLMLTIRDIIAIKKASIKQQS